MITDYDGCSGSGVCVPAVKAADAVPVGYIKPQTQGF